MLMQQMLHYRYKYVVHEMNKKSSKAQKGWLLFFYTVPTKPAGSRTKVWRKLSKIGAVKLKSAVYLLPESEEHVEILTWLVAEISSLGGEGAFAQSPTIAPFSRKELVDLFNRQSDRNYQQLNEQLDRLEQKISRKTQNIKIKNLTNQVNKLQRELYSIKKTDFFSSKRGIESERRIQDLKNEVDRLMTAEKKHIPVADSRLHISLRENKDYQKKTWITRKNPFVDRMACAWLIRSFIDSQAKFVFIDDTHPLPDAHQVSYDISRGDFTHVNDLCTFEVLQIAFDLHNPGLAKLSRIVHAIDLREEKNATPEAEGVEMILAGIRKTTTDSNSALERGMDVFAALYASFT